MGCTGRRLSGLTTLLRKFKQRQVPTLFVAKIAALFSKEMQSAWLASGIDHRVAKTSEEPIDRDGRNARRTPRQETSAVVERRNEGHSQTSVRHSIKNAVTGCCQEISEQGESPDSGCFSSEDRKGDHARQESGENQPMNETAMSPEIAVVDAETESNRIKVGYHRAQHASHPDALRNLRSVEAGADAQGSATTCENPEVIGFLKATAFP
jgi:hypothetical protein